MWQKLIITADPLRQQVCKITGLRFEPGITRNLLPSKPLATLGNVGAGLQQFNGRWGIRRPGQGLVTTVDMKGVTANRIFKEAFQNRRCVIPCSGWAERRDGYGELLHFTPSNDATLLVAGLWFGDSAHASFIALTRKAPGKNPRHLPMLIQPKQLRQWIDAPAAQAEGLLQSSPAISVQSRQAA